MIKVGIVATPLHDGNAVRGVGQYTKLLVEELQKISDLQLQLTQQTAELSKVDIIHYPFFDLFKPTLNIFPRKKTIVTIHDVIPFEFKNQYKPGIKGLVSFLRQRLALQFVTAIITDSEYSKKMIVKHLKISPSKISVIYLAPNQNFEPQSLEKQKQVTKQLNLPEKYLLYVGDINYNKNLPALIKSLKSLPEEIHLVCVGRNFKPAPIPEWKAIELQIALSNVSERVHFFNDLSADELNELSAVYQSSLCYVQPSLSEGFGLPVLEALACQIVVISSNKGSLVEVGGDAVLFSEPTAEAIAENVRKVLELSKSARVAMIKDGADWVKQFSWTRTAHETATVFRAAKSSNA